MREVRGKPEELARADQPVGPLGPEPHKAGPDTKDLSARMVMALGNPARELGHGSAKEPERSVPLVIGFIRGHAGSGAHESFYGAEAAER